jgi:hypothetical protein
MLVKYPIIFAALVLKSCHVVPQRVAMDDPQIQSLLQAAASFDRTNYGFTPIPKAADVRLEFSSGGRYDAMLHINAKNSRTIAFRKTSDGYQVIPNSVSGRPVSAALRGSEHLVP